MLNVVIMNLKSVYKYNFKTYYYYKAKNLIRFSNLDRCEVITFLFYYYYFKKKIDLSQFQI
jgi:hypothetical protein